MKWVQTVASTSRKKKVNCVPGKLGSVDPKIGSCSVLPNSRADQGDQLRKNWFCDANQHDQY